MPQHWFNEQQVKQTGNGSRSPVAFFQPSTWPVSFTDIASVRCLPTRRQHCSPLTDVNRRQPSAEDGFARWQRGSDDLWPCRTDQNPTRSSWRSPQAANQRPTFGFIPPARSRSATRRAVICRHQCASGKRPALLLCGVSHKRLPTWTNAMNAIVTQLQLRQRGLSGGLLLTSVGDDVYPVGRRTSRAYRLREDKIYDWQDDQSEREREREGNQTK